MTPALPSYARAAAHVAHVLDVAGDRIDRVHDDDEGRGVWPPPTRADYLAHWLLEDARARLARVVAARKSAKGAA